MPQMAPINWLSLYFLFISIFLFLIILNYFIFMNMPKSKNKTMNKPLINWKW